MKTNDSCYTDLIDFIKTKNEVIKWLKFLAMFNKLDLTDYLHNSTSIIKVGKNKNYTYNDYKYLDIIEKNDIKTLQIKKILEAIESLTETESYIIKSKYLANMSNEEIYSSLGISESTFKRRIKSSYIKIALKLGIEVLKTEPQI